MGSSTAFRRVIRRIPDLLAPFRQGLKERLCRGPERHDRISLGGGPLRSAAGAWRPTGSPSGERDCGGRTPFCGDRGQGGDHDDSDRLRGWRSDPVELGLVASLNRPGGNITGVTNLNASRTEAAGVAARIAPNGDHYCRADQPEQSRSSERFLRDLQPAARTFGIQLHVLNASTERDFDAVFATLAQARAGALMIGPDVFSMPARAARRAAASPRGAHDLPIPPSS